jgi:hypothetical protein
MIENFEMQNLYFVKPIENPSATFIGIKNLTVKEFYLGGYRILRRESSGISDNLIHVSNFTDDFILSDPQMDVNQ